MESRIDYAVMRYLSLPAIVLLLALSSCSHREVAPEAPEAPPVSLSHEEGPGEGQGVQAELPVVTLVDAGEEPRRPLRFDLRVGDTVRWMAMMEMETEMQMGEMVPVAVPGVPIVMTSESAISGVDDEGRLRVDTILVETRVIEPEDAPRDLVAALEEGMESVVGFESWAFMDDRGFTHGADMIVPPDLNPTAQQIVEGLRDSLDQCVSPLPAEAVGEGARWTVSSTVRAGIDFTQTAHVHLVEMDENHLHFEVEVEQRAEPQPVSAPDLPPGMTARLVSYEGGASGTSHVDLQRLIPVEAYSQSSNRTAMILESDEEAMSVKVAFNLAFRIGEAEDLPEGEEPAVEDAPGEGEPEARAPEAAEKTAAD